MLRIIDSSALKQYFSIISLKFINAIFVGFNSKLFEWEHIYIYIDTCNLKTFNIDKYLPMQNI